MKVTEVLKGLRGIVNGTVPMSPEVMTGLLRNRDILEKAGDLTEEEKDTLEKIEARIEAATLWRGINMAMRASEESYRDRGVEVPNYKNSGRRQR